MNKQALSFLAALLSASIVVVLFAGLDDLPRSLRADIAAEHQALLQTEKQFQIARAEVERALRSEPELFRARGLSAAWPERFHKAETKLLGADQEMAELERLRRENRRQARGTAERLMADARGARAAALSEATQMQLEAKRWLDLKQNLPRQLQQMERDYQNLHSMDLAPVAAVVERAEADWPEKKVDLERRLAALRADEEKAESIWQSTNEARRKVAANDTAGLDYDALLTAANALKNSNATLSGSSSDLKSLAGQLYDSWDKVLVDLEVRKFGESQDYHEKIRTIRTHLIDVAAKKSETTTEEQWVSIPQSTYGALQNHIGMALEHKSSGKYDSESEKVAQPAGLAYVAPPSEGSNQYGRWEHRGGSSFWVFYGQYALMRDLLWGRSHPPLTTQEYNSYHSAQRSGQTYYGRDKFGAPKYGSQGTLTRQHYADSQYVRHGGFSDSRYTSRSGNYRGSQYESPAARKSPSHESWSAHRPAPRHYSAGGRRLGRR